jgi:glycosyltransferase involved in cell wall biosynthesis
MELKDSVALYFIGTGDALEQAKRLAAEYSITLLTHPAVRNEELPEHLAKMDVLVLPSRTTPQWVEQFGHILLEAMAMGIPVIGSSSGEIPNVIGDAGLIFEEGNTAQLAAMLDQLQQNEQERTLLADLGGKRVTEHFTHLKIAQAQMKIYEWMLGEGQPVRSPNNHTSIP